MKRRVIKQGHNTLTITIPRKWALQYSVNPGDELDVRQRGNELVISTGSQQLKSEKMDVDISSLDRSSTVILIQALYRYGYDTIEVSTKEPSFTYVRTGKPVAVSKVVHDIVGRFIGSEIISSSPKSFTIKRISKESNEDFDAVLRNVFRLLNDMVEVFVQALETKDMTLLESMEQHHVNLKKFVNYCLRLLNKFGKGDVRKTTFYFAIIQYLSKIEDLIKNMARYMIMYKYNVGPQAVNTIKEIQKAVSMYYSLFYDYSLKRVSEWNKFRDQVRSRYYGTISSLSKDELVVTAGLMQILELLIDMTELRMALEI
jgi:phosphate uptake regulator